MLSLVLTAAYACDAVRPRAAPKPHGWMPEHAARARKIRDQKYASRKYRDAGAPPRSEDPCYGVTCSTHGQCILPLVDGDMPTCRCNPGYTGPDCGEDIDECASSPCENESVCKDSSSGFVGFRRVTGADGETTKVGIPVPPDSFHCTCRPGFMGDLCDIELEL
jgi:hypothetical protein